MSWQRKIQEYCDKYNIPLEYLSDTLYEPKVVPMIRGKSFEFSIMISLQKILPEADWEVEKVPMNAQQGMHDVDVIVRHKDTGKELSIECKLAAKGKFRTYNNGDSTVRVKCMRSRTLGEKMVKQLAPKLKVSVDQLSVHNDQYLPKDFDLVVTSIGNAFYETNDGIFEWEPTERGISFLESLNKNKEISDPKDFAFNQIYIAPSYALAIEEENGIQCTRKKCTKNTDCGFIPNYPIIKFNNKNEFPLEPWIPIENSEELFTSLINI